MDEARYSAPVSRVAAIAAGLVLTTFGAGFLVLFGVVAYHLLDRPSTREVVIALTILGALGGGLCFTGLRLVTGRRRRDGGLFSPWVLRFGGLFFLAAPVFILFARPSLVTMLEAGALVSAGIACFVIANRREQGDV
jgi:hypothetical protein